MLISELIKALQHQLKESGDLVVFDANDYALGEEHLEVEEGGDNFPDDWEMPEKFLRIGSSLN